MRDGGTGALFARVGSAPSSSLVRMKPADSANMASAETSTIGSFLGQDGVFDTAGGRDDAGIRRGRADAVARGRLAVLGQIGLQQIALRLGIALERAQLHVLLVGRRGLPLELVETRTLSPSTLALRELGVVLERARQPVGFAAHLALEIGDLRAQFLDARMLIEQASTTARQAARAASRAARTAGA